MKQICERIMKLIVNELKKKMKRSFEKCGIVSRLKHYFLNIPAAGKSIEFAESITKLISTLDNPVHRKSEQEFFIYSY